MESLARFLEQNPLIPLVYGLHLIVGVLLPGLWLFLRSTGKKEYNPKLRATVSAWIFSSWGLFASFNLIYIVYHAINMGALGSVIGTLFGLTVFGPIAGLFFWQAHQQWKKP